MTKKKKILLLGDDIRLPSGVGTMSKEIVLKSLDKYDWVQIAGALQSPDKGNVVDLSKNEDVKRDSGVDNFYLKLYPVDGYGNKQILQQILSIEKPDAIIHFTDPRFWGWLYQMEHELRQTTPIMYYNIWDDLPFPHWNEPFYDCCDSLIAISKQTYNINKHVCQKNPRKEGVDLTYVPHGVDEKVFKPLDKSDKGLIEFKDKYFPQLSDDSFVLLFNSRNIQRKRPQDLILAYKTFVDSLETEAERQNAFLILHTDPIDQNGTDLPAVVKALAPKANVIFSSGKIPSNQLNYLYNLSDVTCQPSSAEGFGLSVMESIMSGTPIIASCIGGLQDQMGFKNEKGNDLTVNDYTESWPSNSNGRYKEHGEWAFPMWPQINLVGSPVTPYIYDSRVSVSDITNAINSVYSLSKDERSSAGTKGREWALANNFTAQAMADGVSNSIDICLNSFKPRKIFTLKRKTNNKLIKYPTGVIR